MSFPLWVEPSQKTLTPSSRIARTMAVVVTARPSGVVLKYLRPPVERWNAPHWSATTPSRTIASRQSTTRAPLAPCAIARRRDVGDVRLVGLPEVRRVGVHLEPVARQPGDGGARVEAARVGDADAGARGGERLRWILLIVASHTAKTR